MLNQQRVKKLLEYNPLTGILTWKVKPRWSKVVVGQVAGWPSNGRKEIFIDGSLYKVAQVIWLWMTGLWPEGVVDHEDRDSFNDRWVNLRHVSKSVDLQNRSKQKNNTSGVVGVYRNKGAKKWCSCIFVDGKKKHLGYFSEFEEAVAARKTAEDKFYVLLKGV